jgi:Microtubule associated protein 1A/1B, light chain 3.
LVLDDIRQRIGNLDKNQALFCFVNKTNIVKTGMSKICPELKFVIDMTVGELYAKYKSPDGFLYVEFSDLDTYG